MADSKKQDTGDNMSARLITGEDYDVFASNGLISVDYAKKAEKADEKQKQEGISVSVRAAGSTGNIIVPRFSPVALSVFAGDSPSLAPCISAMEINVDGTGFEIVPSEQMETEDENGEPIDFSDDPMYRSLVDLFTNPYPGETMISIRRNLRRDLEETGNGYIEFLLNNENEVLFMKYLDSKYTRLVEFTEADRTEVPVPVVRNGREFTARIQKNQRRYLYQKGTTARYLKELGAVRDLDAQSGEWSQRGRRIPLSRRGSAVIHFRVDKDHNNEYGLPRWIAQTRSIDGEIQAQNLNLNYFNNGGIPPVIVFLQNGTLNPDSKLALNAALQGSAETKNRGVVVETTSNGGSLEKAATVGIKVERFSSEQQNDSMFGNYAESAYTQIKSSYRLPQIFLGRSEDYNFATAYASIVITEAQVFKPERDEFDAIVNDRVVRGITDQFVFKSRPLIAVDIATQLQILTLAKNSNAIGNEELIRIGNQLSSLDLNWNGEETATLTPLNTADLTPNSDTETTTTDAAQTEDEEATNTGERQAEEKAEAVSMVGVDHARLHSIAKQFAQAIKSESNPENLEELQEELRGLTQYEAELVSVKLAREVAPDGGDLEALAKLNDAANAMLHKG